MDSPRRRVVARFALLIACVLGAPALAFVLLAPRDAQAAGPAMLVFILAPAVASAALGRGVTDGSARGAPEHVARASALAVGSSGALTMGCLALALALGAIEPGAGPMARAGAGALVVSGLVTSTLEELGWAAGATALARRALGPRAGIVALGLVWAAWHLVVLVLAPREVSAGLFPRSDAAAPGPLAGFVVGCVAYRALLTELRDRADGVAPAAIAHATGNVILGVALGGGVVRFREGGAWALFPAPTGLVFAAGALLAWGLLVRSRRRRRGARTERGAPSESR